jgi:amino acid transporter
MLNLSVMASLRNLPIVAEYGLGSLFLYLVVALVFLFPAALISAELATGWTRTGGVYIWVREAFGPKWGFFAVWMQWVHNVTWFPAILSFAATTFAYLVYPEWATHPWYLLGFILTGFWGFTIFNFFGLKHSSWFSALGVIAGTLIPGILLILLGIAWIALGHPLQISLSLDNFIPAFHGIEQFVFITGLFLAFGGLEVSAAHAREVQDPQRNFPRAILIASGLAFITYAFGALAIACVIPQKDINLVAGLVDAFQAMLPSFHLSALFPILALFVTFGAIGELNAWVIGPVRALHATSQHGDLPPVFRNLNKYGIPVALLLFQGLIVTLASFVFLWMPSASAAFWILSAMSAQLYLIMYIFMFLAAIKLRYSHPHVVRPYRIPYHMHGIWFVGGLGALSSLGGFLLGFVPPSQFEIGNIWLYELFLFGGIFCMCLIPLLIYRFKNPSWHPESEESNGDEPAS